MKKTRAPLLTTRPVATGKPEQGSFTDRFLHYFPDINKKIQLARLETTPSKFLEQVLFSTILLSIVLLLLTNILFSILHINLLYLIPLIIVYPPMLFYYLMLYLDVAILKKKREIDMELVFVVRHIVIALRSGMPLFDTLVGVSTSYGTVGKEFNKIVERVTLGTSLSQALRDAAQNSPSKDFTRVLMQITNALASGADVADSLEVVLQQISKDQIIEIKAYGQKLTPLVMFFMIFGIILPSLGVAFAVILFSFVGGGMIGLSSYLLLLVFMFILVVQFLFLSMVESSKPHYII